jgi:hypothetical protein
MIKEVLLATILALLFAFLGAVAENKYKILTYLN